MPRTYVTTYDPVRVITLKRFYVRYPAANYRPDKDQVAVWKKSNGVYDARFEGIRTGGLTEKDALASVGIQTIGFNDFD